MDSEEPPNVRVACSGDIDEVVRLMHDAAAWMSAKGTPAWDVARIDRREARLVNADLSKVDFYYAELAGADLTGANLSNANLTGAQMEAVLLAGANLYHADLTSVNLRYSDLSGVDLEYTELTSAYLEGANLTDARLLMTSFNLCIDLHQAVGLDSLRHPGLSSIDQFSFRKSVMHLPNSFLLGMGYSEDEIKEWRRMYGPLEYYTSFLSHAKGDADFVEKLYNDLSNHSVSCYHFRYHLQGGKPWRAQISVAIKKHDKLILVCSKESLLRENVVSEVLDAMERERETNKQKLFPIHIDNYILENDILRIADRKLSSGAWREDWVRYVRALQIPDFSNWRDSNHYDAALHRLLKDLKTVRND